MSVSSPTFAASVKAVFVAAAVALPMAPLATAQSSGAMVLEEVTVTARCRSESLQGRPAPSSPASNTAFINGGKRYA